MNIKDAAYNTVHDYPGGSVSLAPRLGMSPAILRNKVNPNVDTHHLTLAEADRMMGITNDHRILHALAANHGHVCVELPNDLPTGDLAILELVTQVWRRNGDVGRAVDDTLADGRVEAHEIKAVETAVYETIQALQVMMARLKEMQG